MDNQKEQDKQIEKKYEKFSTLEELFEQGHKKTEKQSALLVLVASLIIILVICVYNNSKQVNLLDGLLIEYTGIQGQAKANAKLELDDSSHDVYYSKANIYLSKSTNLSNGDHILTYIAPSNSDYAGGFKLITVEGLKDEEVEEAIEEPKVEEVQEIEEKELTPIEVEETKETTQTAKYDDADQGQVITKYFEENFSGLDGEHTFYYQRLTEGPNKFVDANSYSYNEQKTIRAASTIKLFILMDFYEKVKNNTINPNETYIFQKSEKVGGTGKIQDETLGVPFTYHELSERMIIDSDNMAANAIIKELGGIKKVSDAIHKMGYKNTSLNRKFMDTKALNKGVDNYITSKDLGDALAHIYNNKQSDDYEDWQIWSTLTKSTDRSLLLKDIPSDVLGFGKTGVFAKYGVANNAVIVNTSKGTYVLVVLTSNGDYDKNVAAINKFGKQVYQEIISK